MILGVVRADDRLRRTERGEDALVALTPVEDVGLGDRVGLDASDLRRDVTDEPASERTLVTTSGTEEAASASPAAATNGVYPSSEVTT